MADPCSTTGCPNAVRVYATGEPLRCDACRADAVLAARKVDTANRCTHLGEPSDPWLRDYGTPEGRAGWIDRQWPSYRSIDRGLRAGQTRSETEARRAAAQAWARHRDHALSMLRYARSCTRGHACNPCSPVLGTVVRDGRVVHRLSVVVCDRQSSCRDYAPAQPPANDQRPALGAPRVVEVARG